MENVECEHRCRNTCTMLNDALRDEMMKIAYYEKMLLDCNEPEMRKFVKEVISTHNALMDRITDRLDVIKTNAEVLDDIIASFES